MWVCKICRVEYEPHRDRCVVCRPCHDRVRALPSQALKIEERLWGKTYEREGCWEYNTSAMDGRIGKLMMDRSQRPATQVALILAGLERPSPKHFAHAACNNGLCVRADHLSWVERIGTATPTWAHGLDAADMVGMIDAARKARAKYQRVYRARLKEMGAPSVRVFAEAQRVATQPSVESPAPSPVSLVVALAGAKIAPEE